MRQYTLENAVVICPSCQKTEGGGQMCANIVTLSLARPIASPNHPLRGEADKLTRDRLNTPELWPSSLRAFFRPRENDPELVLVDQAHYGLHPRIACTDRPKERAAMLQQNALWPVAESWLNLMQIASIHLQHCIPADQIPDAPGQPVRANPVRMVLPHQETLGDHTRFRQLDQLFLACIGSHLGDTDSVAIKRLA